MTADKKDFDWSDQGGDAASTYQSFLVPAIFIPFTEALLDAAEVSDGARVLDIACGTGVVSRTAARRAGAGGAVTGVDMAPPMLAVARAQEPEEGSAPITYLEGDATALPVEDGSFDIVTCHQGLQFFPDRPAALAEMRRALVPGGRAAIGTWTGIAQQPHFAAIDAVLVDHLGEEKGGGMRMPFSLGDPSELSGLLADAGFAAVDVNVVTLPVTFASASKFARLAIGAGPLAPIVTDEPEDVQARIFEDITRRVDELATDDDRLVSSTTSLVAVATAP